MRKHNHVEKMTDDNSDARVSTSLSAARPTTRLFSLLARLRLDSIRNRYLAIAMLFVVSMVGAGGYAQYIATQATQLGALHAGERQEIRELLRSLTNDMWAAETTLHGYLLVPDETERRRLQQLLARSFTQTEDLMKFDWIKDDTASREQTELLARHIAELKKETALLIDVRTDPDRLYPAMPMMIQRMLPTYTDFYTAATLAIDDALDNQKIPWQSEVYQLFAEARQRSVLMTSAFRNFVIFRFGIFGDPQRVMRAQTGDVATHAGTITQVLDKLAELDKRGQLELVQQDSLQNMQRLHREWLTAYRDVAAIITSDRWRSDTPILRDAVLPLFGSAWRSLRTLDKNVETFSIEDLSVLTRLADLLSRSIWWLALVGTVITAAGFLLFELTVRRPIASVAHALRDEAEGKAGSVMPRTTVQETQGLVVAFDHMRQQVRARQERLQTVLDNVGEGIITFDRDGHIEGFNKAAERLFGRTEQEVLNKSLGMLISADQRERREGYFDHFLRNELNQLIGREGELLGRHKDDTTFPMAIKINRMMLQGRELYVALVADISERKAMVQHLKDLAEHDGLTGLHNRTYFQEELERVVERARRDPALSAALLYLDLDNFKYVNDTLGHAAGDRLLLEIAGILNKRLRKTDLLARFGGDEFTVLLYNASHDIATRTAEALRRRLADYAFREGSETVDIGCSIGVTLVNAETKSAEETLSQADLACHLAKRGGRNRVHLFNPADATNTATMSLDMGWSRRIKEAIEYNRFALACQPIVNIRTRVIESFEVLIRMRDEQGELIMPGGFLPAAERFGLSTDIDKWVIAHAIDALAQQRVTLPALRYSINLSGATMSDLSVFDLIQEKFRSTGLDPAAVTFEVTETMAIADMPTAQTFLSRLQTIGCMTALDDFGSGMASFAYLKDLPVNSVKIDGRFVRNMATNPVDQAMVRAMNDIAHALGKETIAEFVENEDSLKLLAEYGVDYAQGYYLGRPDITYPCEAIAEHASTPNLRLASLQEKN